MAMFDKFLRVGDTVINTKAIIYVNLHAYSYKRPQKDGVKVCEDVEVVFAHSGDGDGQTTLQFEGDDAEALRWLMRMSDSPQNLTDLWRNAQKSHHPDNKDRGHAK